jgi:PilZ domain
LVRGHNVDISESGISAMLIVEVPISQVVRLAFNLPLGPVEVHAMVRQRSAFRYGLQFVESDAAQEVIGRTWLLAMEESLRGKAAVVGCPSVAPTIRTVRFPETSHARMR